MDKEELNPTTTQERDAIAVAMDAEVEISNAEYLQNKKNVVKFEKTNYDTIALIPSRGKGSWKKFGDHSALIYYYHVLPLYRKTFPSFQKDMDNYNCFEYGVMSVKEPSAIYDTLKKYDLLKKVQYSEGKVFFSLSRKFTPEQITAWWDEEQARRNRMNEILPVENCLPEFRQKMRQLSKMVRSAINKKMRKTEQETNGERLSTAMDEICRAYYQLMRQFGDKSNTSWENLLIKTDDFCSELQIVVDGGIWSYNAAAKIAELAAEMRELVAHEVKIRVGE